MSNNVLQPRPQPNPDLASLDRLVGTWAVFDPSGHHAISGTVTYHWMEGRFFLMQEVSLTRGDRQVKGLEIIGHEQPFGAEPSPDIKSRYYDNLGSTFDYVYELEGDTLTIWGGAKNSPAYYRGIFSPDGNTNTGAWVYSGGGYASSMTRID